MLAAFAHPNTPGIPMKPYLLPALLLLSLLLPACASHVYSVTMKNGDVYQAEDEPQFDKNSSSYRFKDADGKIIIVNKDDVQAIQQAK